jgi:hypothetical protein
MKGILRNGDAVSGLFLNVCIRLEGQKIYGTVLL